MPIVKNGKVVIPKNTFPSYQEMRVALILTKAGHDVTFMSRRIIPTPDIWFMGREWEIKSPKENTKRTIENCIRHALKQSKNIIIDLSEIKMEQEKAIREVKRQNRLIKIRHNIMIVTYAGKIIRLF